jgi:uncharacterized Zn-binding protein involved in type VI secretion
MMGMPAARLGDMIVNAADIHIVLTPQPTPQPFPFKGKIDALTSPDVRINGRPAAVQGSMATNIPPHIPKGGSFENPPTNLGRILRGSTSVRINAEPAARAGDPCETCHDIPPAGPQAPSPQVVVAGASNVTIG